MINEFKLQGEVLRTETFVTKGGKSIITLVVAIPDDKFPGQCGIKCFGRLAEQAANIQPGTTVNIVGKLGGREWQGKTFSEVIGQSLEIIGEIPAETPKDNPQTDDDIPF